MILKSNNHHEALTALNSEVEDLRQWQGEIITLQEASKPKEDIETKEPGNIKLEDEQEDIEIKDEIIETEVERPNQDAERKNVVSAVQQNKSLRLEWYKVSTDFIPEKYKLQYVHANADARNEKRIFEWYEECKTIGIIPEELQLIPEDTEQENKKQQEQKKSFHKTRKEEWRKRKAAKTKFKVKESEKQENKKDYFFKETETKPPSLKFIFLIMVASYFCGFGAATPMN